MARIVKTPAAAAPPADGLVRVRCMAEDFHLGDGRVMVRGDVGTLPVDVARMGLERNDLEAA